MKNQIWKKMVPSVLGLSLAAGLSPVQAEAAVGDAAYIRKVNQAVVDEYCLSYPATPGDDFGRSLAFSVSGKKPAARATWDGFEVAQGRAVQPQLTDSYSYDAAGNLYAITESRPQTDYLSAYSVLYTAASDAAGNIVLLSQSDSDAVSSYLAVPGYDAAGNLVSFASYMVSDVNAPKQNELASPLTQGTATYDAKGRISSADVTKNWIDWYQGSPEAFGSQTGHMTFHYDKKNRLKTIDCVYTDGEITHHAYTYNRYGQVLTSGGYSEMYPYRTNAEEKFSYKKDGTLVKITYNDDSQVITYTY